MSVAFATWLHEHRDQILPTWRDLISMATTSDNGHHFTPLEHSTTSVIAPADALVHTLLDGFVAAAEGSPDALDALLRTLTHVDSDDPLALHTALGLVFQLRQQTRFLIQQTFCPPDQQIHLIDTLDALFEHIVVALTRAWSDHTAALIREREFIAESLDSASAAADQRALQLKALNDISQRLSASLEAAQVIDLVITSLHSLTGVTHIALWQPISPEQHEGRICLEAIRSQGDEATPVCGLQICTDHLTDLISLAFREAHIQFHPNPDAAEQGTWLQADCGVLALPMIVNERVIGVVSLQDPNPTAQLRYQQDLAQGVIGQAAIALQNAQLYAEVRSLNVELEQRVADRTRELQDEKDGLATIHAIASEVSQTLDLDSLLNASLDRLAQITQAEHASIMLVEEDDSSLLVTRAVLGVPGALGGFARFPIGSGIAGWAAQHRKAVIVHDVNDDARWVTVPGGSLRRREGAMISVPLVVQGEVLGVITLSHQEPGFFTEGHMRLVSACAGAIAIGINNANLFRMISAEAERRYELLDHQQKEASQIAAILQSLSDGVIVCDLYGSVLTANNAAALILQRSVEDLLLWNLHDILGRYLGPRTEDMPLNELIARPMTLSGSPRIFQSNMKVGMRIISLTMGPVLRESDELLGALIVLRDITREVEADRLKTEFIGTMSHELRTPMTAIKGFTQLLAMGGLGPLNETQREFVNTIYNNTERMIALINDVLDITKIESGSVDLEWRSLHLAEALSGVMAELRNTISERHHELTISIPPGLPLIRADAHRLHQILYNLLINAVKYTARGGQIWVEAQEVSPTTLPLEVREHLVLERRYVQAAVRDTGVGISAEDLPRIFDRFYRTENPLKIEAGGTGLGLSLVKPLVELLGGRIWATSVLGEGSTFYIILPVA
jgi:signal transduction histidine kinase